VRRLSWRSVTHSSSHSLARSGSGQLFGRALLGRLGVAESQVRRISHHALASDLEEAKLAYELWSDPEEALIRTRHALRRSLVDPPRVEELSEAAGFGVGESGPDFADEPESSVVVVQRNA